MPTTNAKSINCPNGLPDNVAHQATILILRSRIRFTQSIEYPCFVHTVVIDEPESPGNSRRGMQTGHRHGSLAGTRRRSRFSFSGVSFMLFNVAYGRFHCLATLPRFGIACQALNDGLNTACRHTISPALTTIRPSQGTDRYNHLRGIVWHLRGTFPVGSQEASVTLEVPKQTVRTTRRQSVLQTNAIKPSTNGLTNDSTKIIPPCV